KNVEGGGEGSFGQTLVGEPGETQILHSAEENEARDEREGDRPECRVPYECRDSRLPWVGFIPFWRLSGCLLQFLNLLQFSGKKRHSAHKGTRETVLRL